MQEAPARQAEKQGNQNGYGGCYGNNMSWDSPLPFFTKWFLSHLLLVNLE